ncbi:MAG: type I restriction enzyme HsdR N-terminal domain-containing protein [Firmicutes bacterium]|nr:type I restriction enzyme HsdR N-terminal domain-containing protein [Bacillota bacterium]
MNYQELWEDICFDMNNMSSVREDFFQSSYEFIFEKLGWSRRRGEIISKQAIQVGSNGRAEPDIIIQSGNKKHYIIELKRPSAVLSDKHKKQLFSYMRLARLQFGVLLGNTLQVFYEDYADDNEPELVSEIAFDPRKADGIEIISILTKDGYSFENFQNYCLTKLAVAKEKEAINKKINKLCSAKGEEQITNLLEQNLLLEHSPEVVQYILENINIRIVNKNALANVIVPSIQNIRRPNISSHTQSIIENRKKLGGRKASSISKALIVEVLEQLEGKNHNVNGYTTQEMVNQIILIGVDLSAQKNPNANLRGTLQSMVSRTMYPEYSQAGLADIVYQPNGIRTGTWRLSKYRKSSS